MPLYEYECDACGHRFEIIQKFSDAPAEACTSCGSGPVRKLLSSPAIQFKGSGWYITDYARKSSGVEGSKEGKDKAAAKESTKESSSSASSSESKGSTSETKSGSTEAKSSSSGSSDKK